MKKFLIVVDMQKDFVDGALGTKEAEAIVPNVVGKIEGFDGEIFATLDTHFDDYMETSEGRNLPVMHCIKGSEGWQLDAAVKQALDKKGYTAVEKNTFGSVSLPELIKDRDCTLEWNEGSHFKEPDIRTAKAFAWCMDQLEKTK